MDRRAFMELLKDWTLALVAMVAVVVGWRWLAPSPPTGGDAPILELPMPGGEAFDLASVQADAYVINFWATWCGPCRAEIPEISRFAAKHPEIYVLGVSVDDAFGTEVLAQRAAQLGVTYPIAHDMQGDAAYDWGVSVFPTTFVLNAQRQIVATQQGRVDGVRLEALIASAMP